MKGVLSRILKLKKKKKKKDVFGSTLSKAALWVTFLTKGWTVTHFEIKKKKTYLQILREWRGAGALDKQIDEMLQGSVFFFSPR